MSTSWATPHIHKLKAGNTVQFRPRGNSMTPKIKSGELVTVAPTGSLSDLQAGDIVLCTVHGKDYLHLIKAVEGDRVQIGNNHGRINGWTVKSKVYGVVLKVEP